MPVDLVATSARANGLLTVLAGDNVLRLLPPLNLSDAEIDEGLARLEKAGQALTLASQMPSIKENADV